MPEGVGYGPQNSLSVGKDIHVIGTHVYAYSEILEADNGGSGTDYLSFTTGNYYSVVNIQCYNTVNDSKIINWEFELNGIKIMEYSQEGRVSLPSRMYADGNNLIIPPYTSLIVRGVAAGGAGQEINGAVTLTGRIYK